MYLSLLLDMMRGHDCMDSTSIDSKRTVEYDTIEPRNFTIGIPKVRLFLFVLSFE